MESDNILTESQLVHREKNRSTKDLVELLRFNLSYIDDVLSNDESPKQNNLDVKVQCLELAYRINKSGDLLVK